jgi:hypothetical protein
MMRSPFQNQAMLRLPAENYHMWYRSIAVRESDSTARRGLDKNIENNPMQSRMDPGSQHLAARRPGQQKQGPNLI